MFDFDFDHDAVLRELGLEASTPEVKQQVINGIVEQLSNRVRARLLPSLSPEDMQTLDKLLTSDDAKATEWLASRFPNHHQVYDEELTQLISELKRHADTVEVVSKKMQQE